MDSIARDSLPAGTELTVGIPVPVALVDTILVGEVTGVTVTVGVGLV